MLGYELDRLRSDLPTWLVDADAEVGLVQVRQGRQDDGLQLPLSVSPPAAARAGAAAPSAAATAACRAASAAR